MKKRCHWVNLENPLYVEYHDREWGVPVHDDERLFEMLCLEGAQAGLSWETVLNKRENYRKAFSNFNPVKISKFTEKHVEKLMQNAGIIRNRLKINSVIINAKAYLQLRKEGISFNDYLWSFKDCNVMSKDLKKRGFKFVGATICYAFIQAIGMVNDHDKACFKL
jgi:DNA-3-methyladenine glycosylase I